MRKQLFAAVVMISALGACGGGGGGLSIADAINESVEAECSKAFECMDTYPGADFEDQYGASEADCLAMYEPFLELAIAQLEAAVEDGRQEYNSDDASACIDAQLGASCDDYWTSEPPASCDTAFVGLVATGGACVSSEDCANENDFCVEDVCMESPQ